MGTKPRKARGLFPMILVGTRVGRNLPTACIEVRYLNRLRIVSLHSFVLRLLVFSNL
jgi:hypothetical protein